MCELYVKADPILYESRSRSLRIRGVVTTLRLENQFWDILREIAEGEGLSTNQLITTLRGSDGLSRRGAQLRLLPACQLHPLPGAAARKSPS